MLQRVDELRERLHCTDITHLEVQEYIYLAHDPIPGQVQQPIEGFISAQDIINFHWLHQWWLPYSTKPAHLPTPTIAQFCWFVNYIEGEHPITFNAALQLFHSRAVSYCIANDIDPDNPGEDADGRKVRRNRVRMEKVRAGRKVPAKAKRGLPPEVAAELSQLETQLEALKSEAKLQDDMLRAEVVSHQTAMLASSENRKTAASFYKNKIDNIRADIHKITAKQ
jgi:hypothetical protein